MNPKLRIERPIAPHASASVRGYGAHWERGYPFVMQAHDAP
jgi:hypothetical protein